MLTSKDIVTVLIALVISIVVIVQRYSGKSSPSATKPPHANLKSDTENDVKLSTKIGVMGVSSIHNKKT
jgi:hypothetical protein